jgi:hypothetical protein
VSELYLAERFWPAGGLAELEAASRRLRAAADRGNDTGEQVRYLGSVLVPSDEVVFCLFEAADVAGVRAVNERADVALDRIVGCHGVVGGFMPAPRAASLEGEQR